MQDRIKQMAEEATYYADAMDGSGRLAGRVWSDVRDAYFARLVAEDCARLVDGNAAQCSGMTAELMHSNADAIRARYAETMDG